MKNGEVEEIAEAWSFDWAGLMGDHDDREGKVGV